jgi:CheY-like chemotaxis protein
VGLDLILVAGDLPDMEPLGVIARLRDDARTKNVPIVLVADAAKAADEKWAESYKEKVNAIASVPEGPGLPTETFLQAVNGAFGSPAPEATTRYMVSAAVLGALAETDATNGLFSWGSLHETLHALLKADLPAEIPVKLNATRALGNIGEADCVAPLVELFGSGADAGLRAASAGAIVSICRRGDIALDDAAFQTILKGTADADEKVRAGAFAALGASRLTAAQALEAAVRTRPGEGVAGAPAEEAAPAEAPPAEEGSGCGS